MDNHTRKSLRQVCSVLKTEIDIGTGLKVRVDETPGNLKFIKTVEVQHAVILRMKKPLSPRKIFRCVQNLECLETKCYLTQELYKKLVMPLAATIVSLSLSGSSLMYRSIIPIELASRANLKTSPHIFPQLLTLEIRYGNVQNILSENLEVFNFNMVTILKSFYCPRLTRFSIRPDPNVLNIMSHNPDWITKEHLDWENSPLKAFIHLHRSTLKTLDLFFYAREIEQDYYSYYEPPTALEDFMIATPFIKMAKEFVGKCYWKNIITSSTNFHRLILQVEFWHNYTDFFEIAPSILAKSGHTLTFIRLESFATEEENQREIAEYRRNSIGFSLRFGIFAVCVKLKVLQVCNLNTKKNYVAVDLLNMPRTLEQFEVKNIFLPTDEICELKNFHNLRYIVLYRVGYRGIFGVNMKAVTKLWTSPSLQELHVAGFNHNESPKKLCRLIKEIRHVSKEYQNSNDPQTVVMVKSAMRKLLK